MRALYLFLGEILGHDQHKDGSAARRRPVDDEPLRPIKDGAFARWMAAGDRAVPRVAGVTPARAAS
jgi:hypothetical protein